MSQSPFCLAWVQFLYGAACARAAPGMLMATAIAAARTAATTRVMFPLIPRQVYRGIIAGWIHFGTRIEEAGLLLAVVAGIVASEGRQLIFSRYALLLGADGASCSLGGESPRRY